MFDKKAFFIGGVKFSKRDLLLQKYFLNSFVEMKNKELKSKEPSDYIIKYFDEEILELEAKIMVREAILSKLK